MSNYSYVATYTVTDGALSVTDDATTTLLSLQGQQVYVLVLRQDNTPFTIDLNRFMLMQIGLVTTNPIGTVMAALTDLQVAGYSVTTIPTLNPEGAFANRLNVYDAYITPDITVQWTSINSPTDLDDIYQKDQMNDLKISSSIGRSFANTLVSVNGVFHPTFLFNGDLFVQNGFFNIKNSKRNRVALFDTTTLGGHFVLPITQANIDASNNNPWSGVTLTYPNVDFTGTTVLLSVGGYLYALDSTYQLINTNRLRININRMDVINQFLHNPNTVYTTDALKAAEALVAEEAADATIVNTPPPVADEIAYYFTSVLPFAPAGQAINLISFNFTTGPTVEQEITFYLSDVYPTTPVSPATSSDLIAFSAVSSTPLPGAAISSVPVIMFDADWLYALLMSPSTFLVVIDNPTLYRKTYPFTRMVIPSQYTHHGDDTPRGLLRYNHSTTLPYLLYSEAEHHNHYLSLGAHKICRDVYKTVVNPTVLASPPLDVHTDLIDYPVEMIELYAATG